MTTVAIDKGYKQMFEMMLPTLEKLVERRIDKLQGELRMSIGLAIAMLLVVGYFRSARTSRRSPASSRWPIRHIPCRPAICVRAFT